MVNLFGRWKFLDNRQSLIRIEIIRDNLSWPLGRQANNVAGLASTLFELNGDTFIYLFSAIITEEDTEKNRKH